VTISESKAELWDAITYFATTTDFLKGEAENAASPFPFSPALRVCFLNKIQRKKPSRKLV
jgi:hypothetical protein